MPQIRRTYWLYPNLNRRRRRQPVVGTTEWEQTYGISGVRLTSSRTRTGVNPVISRQMEESYIVDKDQANLVSSNVKDKPGIHAPVLDIDLPAALVPSSQPDHYHLYIDKEVPEEDYFRLLDVLADCGIIERGYAEASKAKGGTFVRPPNVKKPWIEQTATREAVSV